MREEHSKEPGDHGRHLSEARLLTVARGDVPEREKRHLEACASCRERLEGARALTRQLAKTPPGALPRLTAARAATAASEEGSVAARQIIDAARMDDVALRVAVAQIPEGLARSYALLYALQDAAPLASAEPDRALDLADMAIAEAREYLAAEGEASPLPAALLEAEACLVESQANLFLGRAAEAARAARVARGKLVEAGAGELALAWPKADYHEGSALVFSRDYAGGIALLTRAVEAFEEADQAHWWGRAEAALAQALTMRGEEDDLPEALRRFVMALELLDPNEDATTWAGTAVELGTLYHLVGRTEEARRHYQIGRDAALRCGVRNLLVLAQMNLATLLVEEERFAEAETALRKLIDRREIVGNAEWLAVSRLGLGECLAARGAISELRAVVDSMQTEEIPAGCDDAFGHLFKAIDSGWLRREDVSRVARFVRLRIHGKNVLWGKFEVA